MQAALDFELEGSSAPRKASAVEPKAHVRRQRVFRKAAEPELWPLELKALIPKGDASIPIKEALESLDVSSVEELFSVCGGVPYPVKPMLGILCYAYSQGECGSRTIEKHCQRDICYMYVGGGFKPDDRTIRRFRRRVGKLLDGLFKQALQACHAQGLTPMRRVAVDGTKFESCCSQNIPWSSKDEPTKGFERTCTDPDARSIRSSKGFVHGYNCQAAIDCQTGLTLAADVCNVSSDQHLLAPMLKQVIDNTGKIPEQVVADAGYDTNEASEACAELGVEAFIAQKDAVHTFWSVTQEGQIVCPMGQVAQPSGSTPSHGKRYQILRVATCQQCIFFQECCGTSKCRTLQFPEGCDPIHRMNSAYRARSPGGKQAMRERMATIEPIFGDIKWNKGLRRFVLKGEDGARIEWTLIHLARNLKKLGQSLADGFRRLVLVYGGRQRRLNAPVGAGYNLDPRLAA